MAGWEWEVVGRWSGLHWSELRKGGEKLGLGRGGGELAAGRGCWGEGSWSGRIRWSWQEVESGRRRWRKRKVQTERRAGREVVGSGSWSDVRGESWGGRWRTCSWSLTSWSLTSWSLISWSLT